MFDQDIDDQTETEVTAEEPLPADTEEPDQEQQDADNEDAPEEEDTGLVVSFDGEDEPEPEPVAENSTVREMRKTIRTLEKKLKEKEAVETKVQTEQEIGPKPTLAGCDYDDGKFEAAILEWSAKKSEVEAVKAKAAEKAQRDADEWKARKTAYDARKASTGIKDYDEAEDAVREALPQLKQDIIIDAVDRPELLIAALGRSPTKLAELAAIDTTTVRGVALFAATVAKLEANVKQSGIPSKPAPEKRLPASSAPKSTGKPDIDKMSAKEYEAWRSKGGTFKLGA